VGVPCSARARGRCVASLKRKNGKRKTVLRFAFYVLGFKALPYPGSRATV
jgi:hypothetical protein